MLDAALAYARRGLRVHPLTAPTDPGDGAGKRPLLREWQRRASSDEDQVKGWWTRWPTANIGIATGPGSGLWVLDVDGDAGEYALEAYDLPDTTEVRTGKGRHLYWRWPDNGGVGTSRGRLAEGLDVRGEGGYVVAPPSVHASGRVYQWKIDLDDVEDAPGALITAIRASRAAPAPAPDPVHNPGRYARVILDRAASELGGMGEGGRNDALFRAALALVPYIEAGAITRSEVEADLLGAALACGLQERQAEATLRSALERVPSAQTLGRIVEGRTQARGDPPTIMLTRDLEELLGAVWGAVQILGDQGHRLYRLADGSVAHVDEGRAIPLRPQSIGPWLSRRARVRKLDGEGRDAPATLPGDVRSQILGDHDGISRLPPLRGIIDAPSFAGPRLIQDEGYDQISGLYLAPGFDVRRADDEPTEEDITHARRVVGTMLRHFRWADQASLANAVGALLLPLIRGLYDGPTPAIWIDASSPGAGKSHLAKALSIIATGRGRTMALPRSEEELEKRITAELVLNPRAILVLDNIRDWIGGGALEGLITSTEWNGRILGRSESITVSHQALVVLTANDATMSPDMARRVIPIRIEPHPAGWRPPFDLVDTARRGRRDLVWALLTLVQGWISDGSPDGNGASLATFEASTRIVGSVLAWAEIDGWLANHADLTREATEIDLPSEVERLVAALEQRGAAASVTHILEETESLSERERETLRTGRLADALRARGWSFGGRCRRPHPWTGETTQARYWSPPRP